MILRWFLSKTVRQATAMRRHIERLYNQQRDILKPQELAALRDALGQIEKAVADGADKDGLVKQMENLEAVANKSLRPFPNAAWRENVEVLLVALGVAMGIRTFFLQPFKIPTGSMQPTLYGVTSAQGLGRTPESNGNLHTEALFEVPGAWQRVKDWFQGISYVEVRAKCDGELEAVNEPFKLLIFSIYQTLQIGGKPHVIWFPPDYGSSTLAKRAGLELHTPYKQGDEVVRLKMVAGDHLFVDRLTYNFRAPHRGEIIVFDTHGIDHLEDTFYIKRLAGLGDETLSLKPDHIVEGVPMGEQNGRPFLGSVPVGHLVANGHPISPGTPHFQNLYSFDGAPANHEPIPYKENHYFGHALLRALEPGNEYHVEPGHLFAMGDNTMNSSDSRYWGDFPQSKVIGKSFFVYWPISDRFGWGYAR